MCWAVLYSKKLFILKIRTWIEILAENCSYVKGAQQEGKKKKNTQVLKF